jgi:hypothetical protein
VLVFAVSATVFGEETVKVKGTVIKIDESTKSVTIQPKEGDAVTVAMEDADLLGKVKEGQKGQAIYMVKDGTNVGIKLKKLTAGCD